MSNKCAMCHVVLAEEEVGICLSCENEYIDDEEYEESLAKSESRRYSKYDSEYD